MAEEKRFAIVKFTEEDDAPGIIPLSWLTNDYSMCHYPEAKTDQMRERLIKNAVNPQDKMYKWQLFNVQVMHFYCEYLLFLYCKQENQSVHYKCRLMLKIVLLILFSIFFLFLNATPQRPTLWCIG